MNILIPIAKASSKIKSSPHQSLVKISKDMNLIQFQLKTLGELFSNLNIYLFVDEYKDEIKDSINCIKDTQTLSNKIHIIDRKDDSISQCLETGFDAINYSECILIMGNIAFNKGAIKCLFNRKKTSFLMDNKNLFSRNEIGIWHDKARIKFFSYSLPLKWSQICFLSKDFVANYSYFYEKHLLIHEIFNKMLNTIDFGIIQSKSAKAIEIKKPKDARLARQIFG